MNNSDPFENGRKSCTNGIPFTANPYPEFSEDADAWEAGWMHEDDKDMGETHQ